METRASVYKALFWPRFRVCRDCFDSLSDGRSYERCEGAGEDCSEMGMCAHVQPELCKCNGNSAVLSFRKYGNRLL